MEEKEFFLSVHYLQSWVILHGMLVGHAITCITLTRKMQKMHVKSKKVTYYYPLLPFILSLFVMDQCLHWLKILTNSVFFASNDGESIYAS